MKALIVTINDGKNYNFGNKLQNLAVSEVLKKFNVESETLNFEMPFTSEVKRKIKKTLMKLTNYKLARSAESKFYWKYGMKRIENFQKFDRKYLKQHNDFTLTKSSGYDYYIIGSDQVWNPEFFKYHKMKKYAYMLSFCDNNKKICFSPSFGVSEIPPEWKKWFKKYLSAIPHISVREDDGAKIVKELTGKEADVLIDPTLMLSAKEWKKYSKKPVGIDFSEKYILTYFLGEVSDEKKIYINNLAKMKNLKVYNLLDKENPELYTIGVSEFIFLISHSDMVVTDSFHACVFSFIFNRPFVVFNRKSDYSDMSSRLDTLLLKLSLTDRKAKSLEDSDLFEANYKKGKVALAKERKKVMMYLSKAMNIK
ncbi:MAG: polysaccharide pyruvyl transferase family protein [Ruminococcus flavefaciens]|nr:polysaccharide pyruvyl transferase family protein [Ruminococcus flavefaciens]